MHRLLLPIIVVFVLILYNSYSNSYDSVDKNLIYQETDLDKVILSLPEVQKSKQEVYSSYYDLKLTYSQYGLNIQALYRYSYNQPVVTLNFGLSRIRISNDYTYSYGIELNYPIYTFGTLENQILSKELIYNAKILNLQQTIKDSYLKFYTLIYEYAKILNFLEFTKNNLDYTQELLSNTNKLYQAGVIPKVEYLRVFALYQDTVSQNTVAQNNSKIVLENIYSFLYPLQKNTHNSKNALKKFIDRYTNYLSSQKQPPILIDKENQIENSLVAQIIYSNILALKYQKRTIELQNAPKLALNTQYYKQRESSFSRDYLFNVNLLLSWKIFDSSLSANQAKIIDNQIQILQQEYTRTKSNLINSRNSTKSKYYNDYTLYKSYLYNLEYRTELFRLTKIKYQNGLSTYLDYLDAQNNFLQTVLNIKNYKNEIFIDIINYYYLNDQDLSIKEILEII
ncbi:MAG: TolC family protein [bacterium]